VVAAAIMAVVYRNARDIVENTKQKDLLSIMNGHGVGPAIMQTVVHHRMIVADTA
jgi:phosphopentomutase